MSAISGIGLSTWDLVLVLGVVALLAARWLWRWLPSGFRRPVAIAAAAVTASSGIAVALFDPRWQLVPILVAGVLAVTFTAVPLLRDRARPDQPPRPARRWRALTLTAVCLLLTAGGGGAAWALPVPTFPQPSGPFPVGTTVTQWTDPDRPETATAAIDDRRTVVVQLWYPAKPAAAGTPRAHYLGRTTREARTIADGLGDTFGIPSFLLDGPTRARTFAVPDAAVADGRFPVVLFSPGAQSVRTVNTALAEDLASRGYVVAGLDHPYDSAAVVLADGNTVYTRTNATGDADRDDAMVAQTNTVRAADLSFVLTRLERLDRGQESGPLTGHLDTGEAAATGHSLGGSAALQAARLDHRFSAVVDLDGYPHDPAPGPYPQTVLALTSQLGDRTDPDYLPQLTKVLQYSTATSYRLTLPGATHLSFTDAPLYLPPLPTVVGAGPRARWPRLTAQITAAFLDATLKQQPIDLPAALARYGELVTH